MLMSFLSHAFMRAVCRRILIATVALTVWGGTMSPGHAVILTGSGLHIPLGPFVTSYPVVGPVYTEVPSTSFTGTWSASAAAAWQGTFTGTGPIPISSARPSGFSTYDFTGLANNVLPTGSYFFLSDLDSTEKFTVQAFDALNNVITSAWLGDPFSLNPAVLGVSGTGVGGGAPLLTDMPGWDWNVTAANTYTFDGTTINTGNPNVTLALGSNQAIRYLQFNRNHPNASFNIGAPIAAVPEPATVVLLAGCFGASVLRRQWRRRSEAKS